MALAKLIDNARVLKAFPAYLGRSVVPDTPFWVSTFSKVSAALNAPESLYRKNLAKKLQKICSDITPIFDEKGYLVSDMSGNETVMEAVRYAKNLADQMDLPTMAKTSRKDFLLNHAIDIFDPAHKKLVDAATDYALVAPISQYLGSVPVLASISIWYSPNNGETIDRSQLYHLDGEDFKQVKCFLPLADVDEDSGPLTIIPAKESQNVYNVLKAQKKISKRNEKLDDSTIYEACPSQKGVTITGKPGTVAFVDTCRCYHYGSRPSPKPRLQLHLHYYTAFSTKMPVWGRNAGHDFPAGSQDLHAEISNAVINLTNLDFSHVRRQRNKKVNSAG